MFFDYNLKWSSHVDEICTKALRRFHFLKVLKRSAVSVDDLYYFYVSAIRPVLDYAICPMWHTSLTKEQTMQVESVQKRAFRIITACAVATSCCISDTPSQWERPNFDPP